LKLKVLRAGIAKRERAAAEYFNLPETVAFDDLVKLATGRKLYLAKKEFGRWVLEVVKTTRRRDSFLATLQAEVPWKDALALMGDYQLWATVKG
jgi:hypothetical protein